MSIPAEELARAELLLSAFWDRVPKHVRDQVQVRHRRQNDSFILFEWRPPFSNPEEWIELPVAKFEYDDETGEWRLYRKDANSRWRVYEWLPTGDLPTLCREVEADPRFFFWG